MYQILEGRRPQSGDIWEGARHSTASEEGPQHSNMYIQSWHQPQCKAGLQAQWYSDAPPLAPAARGVTLLNIHAAKPSPLRHLQETHDGLI